MRLAKELRRALDDPKRYEWGEGPWEHLGDAERDVRQLLDYIERLELVARVVAGKPELGESCACDTIEEGWRPCPTSLCERTDHTHEDDVLCDCGSVEPIHSCPLD